MSVCECVFSFYHKVEAKQVPVQTRLKNQAGPDDTA